MLPMARNVVDSREGSQQGAAECQDSPFLFAGPRITSAPIIIQASNVSNPDRVCVVALTVRALDVKRPTDVDRPISVDKVMIPDVLPFVVVYVVAAY